MSKLHQKNKIQKDREDYRNVDNTKNQIFQKSKKIFLKIIFEIDQNLIKIYSFNQIDVYQIQHHIEHQDQ